MKKIVLISILFMSITSCVFQKQDYSLVGEWYHLGYLQTQNIFYSKSHWIQVKDSLKSIAKQPANRLIRPDIYIKLTLNKDYTFTENVYDFATNKNIDTRLSSMKNKWQLEGMTLALNEYEKDTIQKQRQFKISTISKNSFKALFTAEKELVNKELIATYDLAKKQQNLQNLIYEIGIDNTTIFSDTWDIITFEDYIILRDYNYKYEDEAEKYNIKDVLYSGIWDCIPLYSPIGETASERLALKDNNEAAIIYQVLGSASGKCGTLDNDFFPAHWQIDDKTKIVTFLFDIDIETNPVPYEVKNLFNTNKPLEKYTYKIVAKNKAFVILKKL